MFLAGKLKAMAERPEDLNLPASVVARIIKDAVRACVELNLPWVEVFLA